MFEDEVYLEFDFYFEMRVWDFVVDGLDENEVWEFVKVWFGDVDFLVDYCFCLVVVCDCCWGFCDVVGDFFYDLWFVICVVG